MVQYIDLPRCVGDVGATAGDHRHDREPGDKHRRLTHAPPFAEGHNLSQQQRNDQQDRYDADDHHGRSVEQFEHVGQRTDQLSHAYAVCAMHGWCACAVERRQAKAS